MPCMGPCSRVLTLRGISAVDPRVLTLRGNLVFDTDLLTTQPCISGFRGHTYHDGPGFQPAWWPSGGVHSNLPLRRVATLRARPLMRAQYDAILHFVIAVDPGDARLQSKSSVKTMRGRASTRPWIPKHGSVKLGIEVLRSRGYCTTM